MPTVQNSIMSHAFRTNQINLQGDELFVSNNVSKTVLKQLNAAGLGSISQGDTINLSNLPPNIFKPTIDKGDIDKGPSVIEALLRQMNAKAKIQEKYAQLGGKLSPLGLLINPDLGVQFRGNTYVMDYRGGQILLENDQTIATKLREIEVWWTGLECVVKQEKVDEVYGTVAVIVPGSGFSLPHKFPGDRDYWEMGPDEQRIIPVGVLLYKGPPMTISLAGSLVEHDSGNIEEYKKAVAEAIAKAAASLATMEGVPAEATAANQGFIDKLSGGIVDACASVLGADDDQYMPVTQLIQWTDILNQNYTRNKLRRSDDSKSLDYTHVLTTSGVDQGGDRGVYQFYFDIRSFDIIPVNL